jgi:hypothetical protein
MACGSGFQELASRNPFIQGLVDDGYDVDLVGGYFVIYGLPYLDANGTLAYGDWVSPIDLRNGIIDPPSSHQAWFRGSPPHDGQGRKLHIGTADNKITVAEGFVAPYSFSLKLLEGGEKRQYRSFEEKVQTYLQAITAPAMAAFPEATPLRAIEKMAQEQGSPLKFPDMLSARYHLNDLAFLLKGKRVAVIGLGGTGSYILDFIVRTHLAEIALLDDDKVHVHTIFRFPGFIPRAIGELKVNALAQQYGNWHGNIVPIPERVAAENIDRLEGFDFVFLALDDGPSRIFIADWLSGRGIPFVDCGMGLNRLPGGLNGVVRITGTDRAAYEQTANTVHLPGGDPEGGEYRKQSQIAELNALNATLAIIRFKQHFGIYDREDGSNSYLFETTTFDLDKLEPKT